MTPVAALGAPVPGDVRLTAHAQLRFHERVRPALGATAAAGELKRLALEATFTTQEPAWLEPRPESRGDGYLLISDEIVLPLVRSPVTALWYARTCITRGGISEKARAHRNKRACAKRARRRRGT